MGSEKRTYKQSPQGARSFLNLLRASNNDFNPREQEQQSQNDETVRAGNIVEDNHHRGNSALPDLFVPPPSTAVSADELEAANEEKDTSVTLPQIFHPVIRPRTSLLEDETSLGIPHVASTATLMADNTTQADAAGIPNGLPPRPPMVAGQRDVSTNRKFYHRTDTDETATQNLDHGLLRGEGISDEEFGEPASPASSGEKHANTPSSMSPRTQKAVEKAFLHPKSLEGSKHLSHRQLMSPRKRPEAVGMKDRSISFEADFQRRMRDQARHQPTPSTSDILFNSSIGSASGDSSDFSMGMRRKRLQSDASSRTINLEDLLASGPYEIEAETNILKALEEQPNLHRRYISETSTILSGVPDALAHEFSLEDEEENAQLHDGSLDANSASNHGTNSSEEGENPPPPPPPPVPLVDAEENMPLIKVSKPKMNHRRTMSVEDRLAGLTIEYGNLEESNGRTAPNEKEKATPSNNNRSSGDVFRQNTAVIARMEPPASPSAPMHKYTDFSTERLPAVVETDEENPQAEGESDESSNHSAEKMGGKEGNGASVADSRRSRAKQKIISKATDRLKDDLEAWRTFFSPRRDNVKTYAKFIFIYMGVPLIGTSIILYYGFHNPPTIDENTINQASASWWLLFCMRQVITLSLSLFLQLLIVDFLSVGTRVMLQVVGPILTLLIVQSRGWPFVFFLWSILDFALVYGKHDFAKHWLYWQDYIKLFNEKNPGGDIVDDLIYTRVLMVIAIVSVVVAIKRFVVGLWLSRNTFNHYGEQLAKVMNKMVLVSQVAQLSRKLHKASHYAAQNSWPREATSILASDAMKRLYSREDLDGDNKSDSSSIQSDGSKGTKTRDTLNNALDDTQRMKLFQLLDEWEEPNRDRDENSYVSISAVLRFRNALNLIRNDYAFSFAFGPTHSRDACIQSSQETYARLLSASFGEPTLHFETLGLIAILDDSGIDQEKARDLVKVFRPRRDGILTMLDFVKSTDSVYKEFRLLQASIQNSSQIDIAFENLLNVFFYAILVTVILSIMGFDPLSLFLSLSSVILAFAFMIGSASSKYFEGILFILVRRPYGIGDIIHVSNTEMETNMNGSVGWIVQKVSLFETVATWVPTLEKASFNNGSLANSRIINWRRSPHAKVNIQLHFPIETKYEQIEIFKRAVEEFMKVRPREWLTLNGFRVNRILTEQSYMQVTLLIQHRDSWQSIAQVLDSKSNLVTYCSEVQKKLGMQYKPPALPVDLRGAGSVLQQLENNSMGSETGTTAEEDSADAEARMNYFRLIAKTRHQIRAT